MKPGPELDALIAEKVMGWPKERVESHLRQFGFLCSDTMENDLPRFSPSTDIAAAWEVVEKLRPMWVPALFQSDDDVRLWRVELSQGMDFVRAAEADTAPHAICLAALAACNVGA